MTITVLGIHDGHNSSACLLRDGVIVAALAEERLSRIKNDAGYPRRAVEAVLAMAGSRPSDLDAIALGTRFILPRDFYLRWDWYRVGYRDQLLEGLKPTVLKDAYFRQRTRERRQQIMEHLGVPDSRISIVEHHSGHAAAAYRTAPWDPSEPTLVLTLDGSGDGICSTVNIGENGRLTRIAQTPNRASLGKLYSRVTFLLGMRPWEHEYKVMGLAPYADDGAARSYEVMRHLVALEDGALTFHTPSRLQTNYSYEYLRRNLEGHRFDWIAGGVQRLTEDLVTRWVANAVAHTGIRRVACGGGVFMNVKANLRVLESGSVDDLYVLPGCGDESLSIGAAHVVSSELQQRAGTVPSRATLSTAYLGSDFSASEIGSAVRGSGVGDRHSVEHLEDIEDRVAGLLADGRIVARFAGAMEWGARSLGNRSILADPRRPELVRELNTAIKQRDFWMPFAPTMLWEGHDRYVHNPWGVSSPHMMAAFRTTEVGKRDFAAAIHPYDETARPQLLREQDNPSYHRLIRSFEGRTGVAGMLNTSFNIHGEPIVCSPEDAISTFERSGLRHLAVGSFLISK